MVFVHKECGQSPDLIKVIEKHIINILQKRTDGTYRLEITFNETDEHKYICDKCNNPLTEAEILELLKKVYIPDISDENESLSTPTT